MAKNHVIRNKQDGKAQQFFWGKDGKKPLLLKILLLLIFLVLLAGVYLIYRDASAYQRGESGTSSAASFTPQAKGRNLYDGQAKEKAA